MGRVVVVISLAVSVSACVGANTGGGVDTAACERATAAYQAARAGAGEAGTAGTFEQREVLAILVPASRGYDSTPVTCATQAEKQTAACSYEVLKDQDVVFLGYGPMQATKYRLGPVLISGDAIKKATAVYNSGGLMSVAEGWQVDFALTSSGTRTFAVVTTGLIGKQLAIVLDQVVVSAPTVQAPITNGAGVITGSFTEQQAKDLAAALNASPGALLDAMNRACRTGPYQGEQGS